MVDPDGNWMFVERIGHNYGKIHDVDIASFRVRRFAADGKTLLSENTLNIPGPSFRKVGLGKDVTDKFLAGLPGVQKKAPTASSPARFVLHRMPAHPHRLSGILRHGGRSHASDCGNHRLLQARRRRRAGWRAAGGPGASGLALCARGGLRHQGQGQRAGRKMVLIADIVSDDEAAVGEAASHIVRLANARNGEGFIAVTRKRAKILAGPQPHAAISRHTNAFKINEDVVIPLPRLGDYSDGIERINIELSMANKLRLLDQLTEFSTAACRWTPGQRRHRRRTAGRPPRSRAGAD